MKACHFPEDVIEDSQCGSRSCGPLWCSDHPREARHGDDGNDARLWIICFSTL